MTKVMTIKQPQQIKTTMTKRKDDLIMALTDTNGTLTAADVAAVVNGNRGGFGLGDGNSGWWILLLFLFAMGGGNFGGWGSGGAMPLVQNTQADIQRGFDQQSVMGGIAGINNALSDAAVARCNAETTLLQSLSNNQMGLLTTLNANQNATTQGMNNLAMSLQQCCCDNRQSIADLKYTVAQENCADRQAISDGLRDVIANNTANTNAILQGMTQGFQGVQDKLCQMEIDALKERNATLQNQLNMANLAASQTAQTAQIIQDNNAQTFTLINRLAPTPIPAYTVPAPNVA